MPYGCDPSVLIMYVSIYRERIFIKISFTHFF
jgi:hypothetical protein